MFGKVGDYNKNKNTNQKVAVKIGLTEHRCWDKTFLKRPGSLDIKKLFFLIKMFEWNFTRTGF